MGLRKGHCYTQVKRAYTRTSKVRSKSYIKTVPHSKIAKFVMGNIKKRYVYPMIISLTATEAFQVRDNALEASRQHIHRELEKLFKGDYCFVISAYPHHILRENKMLTGAGADRMQTGMQLSFGKAIGIAARIKKGGDIFIINCNKEGVSKVRKMIGRVKSKLPGKKVILVRERQ